MTKKAIAEGMAFLQTENIVPGGGICTLDALKPLLPHSKGIQDNQSFCFSYNVNVCLQDAAETLW